ncbi:F-box protein Pof14 [Schizosaccharomyces cryophilus OY26]|uniref:F-box protein Pof14 n=1 Tax=Schizosaccharomyces cryophilus (strain OY26 / ATCC MYA-4695 / CBS 11777 / NBRC 106824 / NRRL Y48691) TaxID=653667 RepID=S9W141_SCHCR|nr:F-box protein Pof14 [Schizosaccharomyces cryophilus OY26]EPY51795.1 F-box protein Pof14 [Schizosaccharomyces cryophilus OY26]
MPKEVEQYLDLNEEFIKTLAGIRKRLRSRYLNPQTLEDFIHALAHVRAMKRLNSFCSNFEGEYTSQSGQSSQSAQEASFTVVNNADVRQSMDPSFFQGNILELINDYAEYSTQLISMGTRKSCITPSTEPNRSKKKTAGILDCPDEILILIFQKCFDATYKESIPFAFTYRRDWHTLLDDLPYTCTRFRKILSPKNDGFWKRVLDLYKKPEVPSSQFDTSSRSLPFPYVQMPNVLPVLLDPSIETYSNSSPSSSLASLPSQIQTQNTLSTGSPCEEPSYIEFACNVVGRCTVCKLLPKRTKSRECIKSFYRSSIATNICDQCLEAIIDFYEPVSRYDFYVMVNQFGVGYITRPGQRFPSWLSEHVQLARDEEKAYKYISSSQIKFASDLFRLFQSQF